ncbi:amidase [Paenibacillus camerounensis]|uniref:amidase n=1 Tax=Paenibacillus camerounensis TaxID=1243663 RepID=UPI0005A901C3|nr:amidase [Paenibacillus camerounensis]
MQLIRNSLNDLIHNTEEAESSLSTSIDRYLRRFRELEPQIHAFVPEARLEQRLKLEQERLLASLPGTAGKPALWGITVGIKDLIHVNNLPTQAGSRLPAEALAGEEASIVTRLRELGAVIAGKTVTEEFAYNGPIATLNPHNPAHTPGGSSAGSAAAVAAGLCPLALGTQTLRSVLGPASFCGVVGYKLSYDRVPLDGVLRLSPSFDTLGLFTQDLSGMETAAELLVPHWNSRQVSGKPVLGIPMGIYTQLMSEEVKAVFAAQIQSLEQLGYQVKQVQMPWEDEFIYGNAMLRFIQGELAREHADRFSTYEQFYGASVRDAMIGGEAVPEGELAENRQLQLVLRDSLKILMEQEGIDLWVSPAQGGTAPKLEENNTGWVGMTAVWSFAGCPAISIPAADIGGLPLGFQCVGNYGEDEWLLAWARQVALDLCPDRV